MLNDGSRVSFVMPGITYTGVAKATVDPDWWRIELDPEFEGDNPLVNTERLTVL